MLSARTASISSRKVFDTKPVILLSICDDAARPGNYAYNGGIKLLNLWAKLLRDNGHEAFVVTFDGTYIPWLIEHQPHVSLAEAGKWAAEGRSLKFVTIGLEAGGFLDLADQFYYFDAELAWTLTYRADFDRYRKEGRIRRIGTHSRTQQAWYMAEMREVVTLVQEWSDPTYWQADDGRRQERLAGYMNEQPGETEFEIDFIENACAASGEDVRFVEVRGSEREVLETLQTCDFFLGMNPGKHPIWGEGCPRSQQEAMHAGCVVIAYDVNGNREFLIDGYNGFLSPGKRADLLAERLVELLSDPHRKEMIRENARRFIATFTPDKRWRLVREFLELDDPDDSPQTAWPRAFERAKTSSLLRR